MPKSDVLKRIDKDRVLAKRIQEVIDQYLIDASSYEAGDSEAPPDELRDRIKIVLRRTKAKSKGVLEREMEIARVIVERTQSSKKSKNAILTDLALEMSERFSRSYEREDMYRIDRDYRAAVLVEKYVEPGEVGREIINALNEF